jgi:hypothetical protein
MARFTVRVSVVLILSCWTILFYRIYTLELQEL